ncbi:MAG TPA: DUF1987 domain-containing protein [Bacteroidales bacterium]|nr:MAG: hypothetical protein BWY22_00228 [Bacteroidetes bacterium ADurb.Bin217]HPH15747.1 DUF1987 domain-containing protein [Bacteroidales bacterium]HPM12163.1 DUF1987 domain-containing protein [Bacteroidales bacterium]
MKVIDINHTDKTPEVIFDTELREFRINGYSRPENIREFYVPILNTLQKEFSSIVSSGDTNLYSFHFQLEYYNSSSAKFISDIIKVIKQYADTGLHVSILWYFDKDDDEMQEAGEDFSSISNIPFKYIAV